MKQGNIAEQGFANVHHATPIADGGSYKIIGFHGHQQGSQCYQSQLRTPLTDIGDMIVVFISTLPSIWQILDKILVQIDIPVIRLGSHEVLFGLRIFRRQKKCSLLHLPSSNDHSFGWHDAVNEPYHEAHLRSSPCERAMIPCDYRPRG
jgi:hypothetical protein